MTYHLRRLRLHGIIQRIPKTHRYEVTEQGLRIALFCTRSYLCWFRPGLAQVLPETLPDDTKLQRAFLALSEAIAEAQANMQLAA